MSAEFTPGEDVRAIRASLDHPIIDADAHTVEYLPSVRDRLREVAGADVVRRFDRHYWTMDQGPRLPRSIMRRFGIPRPAWWTYQARNSLDRATSMLPRLQYERLPEFGIDFAVIYPSYFIQFPMAGDEDFRRGGCRAVNEYLAEAFDGLGDRMIPVATIPTHTPEEALDELTHVTRDLGMRAVVLNGAILRSVGDSDRVWLDTLGLDSEHDYSGVWQFCQDNGLAVTFHSSGMGWGSRASVSNFMHNHIGHFAAAGDATAKSLLFAGIPRRYPNLRFAFLEGGVAWAAALFAQFCSNFSKRSGAEIKHYDPREMDVDLIRSLLERYGDARMRRHADELEHAMIPLSAPVDEIPDEFAQSGFGSVAEIREVFERSYFFGCEGDDPLSVLAAESLTESLGVRLNPIYGSDIGHWDVRDMREVLPEAYELVEHGVFSARDFRHLMLEAPAHLFGDNNPDFYSGTCVQDAVESVLGAVPAQAQKAV